jgi:hypothetical protein
MKSIRICSASIGDYRYFAPLGFPVRTESLQTAKASMRPNDRSNHGLMHQENVAVCIVSFRNQGMIGIAFDLCSLPTGSSRYVLSFLPEYEKTKVVLDHLESICPSLKRVREPQHSLQEGETQKEPQLIAVKAVREICRLSPLECGVRDNLILSHMKSYILPIRLENDHSRF